MSAPAKPPTPDPFDPVYDPNAECPDCGFEDCPTMSTQHVDEIIACRLGEIAKMLDLLRVVIQRRS